MSALARNTKRPGAASSHRATAGTDTRAARCGVHQRRCLPWDDSGSRRLCSHNFRAWWPRKWGTRVRALVSLSRVSQKPSLRAASRQPNSRWAHRDRAPSQAVTPRNPRTHPSAAATATRRRCGARRHPPPSRLHLCLLLLPGEPLGTQSSPLVSNSGHESETSFYSRRSVLETQAPVLKTRHAA